MRMVSDRFACDLVRVLDFFDFWNPSSEEFARGNLFPTPNVIGDYRHMIGLFADMLSNNYGNDNCYALFV